MVEFVNFLTGTVSKVSSDPLVRFTDILSKDLGSNDIRSKTATNGQNFI